jgi:hypothetical protein
MHGSSSVPQDLLAEIRQFGGDMKETYGVPVEEIQEAIKHGVRKINIDTDIRLAMTAAIRKFFAENPSKFDPRDYLKPAREAARKICWPASLRLHRPRARSRSSATPRANCSATATAALGRLSWFWGMAWLRCLAPNVFQGVPVPPKGTTLSSSTCGSCARLSAIVVPITLLWPS